MESIIKSRVRYEIECVDCELIEYITPLNTLWVLGHIFPVEITRQILEFCLKLKCIVHPLREHNMTRSCVELNVVIRSRIHKLGISIHHVGFDVSDLVADIVNDTVSNNKEDKITRLRFQLLKIGSTHSGELVTGVILAIKKQIESLQDVEIRPRWSDKPKSLKEVLMYDCVSSISSSLKKLLIPA